MNRPASLDDYNKLTIYIDTSVDKLRLQNNNLVVEGESKFSESLNNIGNIIIRGNISITTNVLVELMNKGVSISLLGYYGNYKCTLHSDISGNVKTRHEQLRFADSDKAFTLGKQIIVGKMRNQLAVLDRYCRNYGSSDEITSKMDKINSFIDYATISFNREQLFGYEGNAAEIYFSCFPLLIRKDGFEFRGRSYHPPQDNINAMLSYGYGLLRSEVEKCIRLCGLDPFVGFLHSEKSGKSSLALDLMEEYRSYFIDRTVFNLINRNEVKCDGFEQKDGVYCNKDTRYKIIEAFENKKQSKMSYNGKSVSNGEIIFRQVQLLVRTIKGEDKYTPNIWR